MTDSPGSDRQLRHRSQSTCQMRISAFVRDSPGSPSITHDSLRLHCPHSMFSFHGRDLADCGINQSDFFTPIISRDTFSTYRLISVL
ncbi:hypothetical protein TNCT_625761 [Trichonephila clavata]|uniref:Uncharacterized protein n=1 Tax=Trichonephila clavata TaxID=2740835 RepID=A0A8X6FSL8_TRICU|nr:hypothetical protein TNCT_625761 [Trichonephila clavata]